MGGERVGGRVEGGGAPEVSPSRLIDSRTESEKKRGVSVSHSRAAAAQSDVLRPFTSRGGKI